MLGLSRVLLLSILSKILIEVVGNDRSVFFVSAAFSDGVNGGNTKPEGSGEFGDDSGKSEVDFKSETVIVPEKPVVHVETTVGPDFVPNPLMQKGLGSKGGKLESIKEEEIIAIPGKGSPIDSMKKAVVTVTENETTNDSEKPSEVGKLVESSAKPKKKKRVSFSDEVKVMEPIKKGPFTSFGYTASEPKDEVEERSRRGGFTAGEMVVGDLEERLKNAYENQVPELGLNFYGGDEVFEQSQDLSVSGNEYEYNPVYNPVSYDEITYADPFEITQVQESKMQRLKNSAKETISQASKKLDKAAKRTKNETLKLAGQIKSKSGDIVKTSLSKTKGKIGDASAKTAKFTAEFGEKFKDSTVDALEKSKKKIKSAGHKTKKELQKLAEQIRCKSGEFGLCTAPNAILPRNKIPAEEPKKVKLAFNLRKKKEDKKRGSSTMYFRDKLGRLLSEEEIKYMF